MGTPAFHCPGCKTRFFERVPVCPICGHRFYSLTEKDPLTVWIDYLSAPGETIAQYNRSAVSWKSWLPLIASLILTTLYSVTHPFLSMPVMSWAFVSPVLKSGYVSVSLWLVFHFLLVMSLYAGLSVRSGTLKLSQVTRSVAGMSVPWVYCLLLAWLFRVLNRRGVVFEDSVFDWLTAVFDWLFVLTGVILALNALRHGLEVITGLTGFRLLLYSIGFPLMIVGLVVLIILLFAAGIFFS